MLTPSSAALLDAWDAGWRAGPSARAVALLISSCPEEDPGLFLSLPIGARDGRLLDLREQLFGPSLTGLITCTACGERLEVAVATTDLRALDGGPRAEFQTLTVGEWELSFRLPNSRDLTSIEGAKEESAARRALLARCLVAVTRAGVEVTADEVPDELAGVIGRQMGELDRQATTEVAVECPACNHAWFAPLDVAAFIWGEIDAWARRRLRQVHEIATAYSWSEADILRLSPARRARY